MKALDYALKHAASGIPFFICRPNDEIVKGELRKAKSPRTLNGFHDATTDPDKLSRWFTRYPDSLLGMPTGKASGRVVVDVDPDGMAYADARTDWGNPRVQTTRRGRHLIYRADPDTNYINDANVLAQGIDIRGDGGYVIVWEAHGLPATGEPCDVPATLAPEIVSKPRIKAEPTQIKPVDWELLRKCLFGCDPDMAEDEWVHRIWAIHHATNGSEQGLELVDEWSSQGKKYKGRADVAYKWNRADRDGGITGRLIGYDPVTASDFSPIEDDIELERTAPAKAPMFPVTKFADLVTYKPLPYLVDGLIPRAEVGAFYGASGSGKTFFVLDIALRIAAGMTWRFRKTKQGRVLYICAEGAGGFRMRARAFADAYGLDLETVPFMAILAAPVLGQPVQAKAIIQAIKDNGGADFVIVDTLAATTPGADENSSKDMGPAISACKAIHAQTGATVALVHHSGKDQARGMRGWSGLRGAMDFEIEITAGESLRYAEITKMKDGEEGERFAFVLESRTLFLAEDGKAISSCIVRDITLTQTEVRKPRGQFNCKVLDAVRTLAIGNSPPSVHLEAVIDQVAPSMPFEPGKRDTRRQDVRRAIRALSADDFISISNNVVTIE